MHKVAEKIGRELTSWKEIAAFLDVSVRTAQRYEVELGLPVRRLTGEKGRAVAANVDDLAAWKRKHVATPTWWQNPVFLRRYAIASTCLVLVLSAYVAIHQAAHPVPGKPRLSHWEATTFVVTDDRNREVFRKVFESAPRQDLASAIGQYLGDLDGDGRIEIIMPYISSRSDTIGAHLYCYSEKGEELWRLQPKPVVSDRVTKFSSIYVLRGYQVFPSPERDGTKWIITSFVHHYDYPSVAILVDSKGKQRGQYWHSGHFFDVHTTDLNGDGIDEVLLAGTDKDTNRAMIRIFDPRQMSGAQVMPRGHPNQLLGFPPGTEKATVLFERTRLNKKFDHFNFAYWIGPTSNPTDRSFQVSVSEHLDGAQGYLTYTIRPDLSITSVFASDSLRNTYLEYALKDPKTKPFEESDMEDLKRGYTILRR
ncbi:MAG: hypothetical protein JJE04_23480 [Acidobacteriia bacterium]|nr:hypothetical protein [Terriglobia bacterium]